MKRRWIQKTQRKEGLDWVWFSVMACNGWLTTLIICLDNILSIHIITHTHTHTHTHAAHIYCTNTDAQFLPLSLPPALTHCWAWWEIIVWAPLIDCLLGITFQTINTIKNPLKPLKPQRTSNHLTIKTHREKKKLTSPVRAHKHSVQPPLCCKMNVF